MVNRIAVIMDEHGGFTFTSDEPVEIFVVCDFAPNDRVYQSQVTVGMEKVQAILRDDQVGHYNDASLLGTGLETKRQPSKRILN